MLPRDAKGCPIGLPKAPKGNLKRHPKRTITITPTTPPTQLSNYTATKMISAQRNARSAPPPHLGRRARHHSRALVQALVLVQALLPEIFDRMVLVPHFFLPPGHPAHSAWPTAKNQGCPCFGLQNRIQNFTQFFKAFLAPEMLPKRSQNDAKIDKTIHCFSRPVFGQFFLPCLLLFCSLVQPLDL